MIPTAGDWDRSDRHCFFLAGGELSASQPHVLLAVNELGSPTRLEALERMLDAGTNVLIDSGIFWLTNEHKRTHGITMNEALALAPEEIDGWDWLWDRYLSIVTTYGDRVWGYIELDQGGMENKRRTRQRLRDLGLRPMPVYHPLNDGWDYFDELATETDRLCWGNVVQASHTVRRAFMVTLWERHRAYPDLWVHVLGLTPNQHLNAYPVDSADSSTWLAPVRWSLGYTERAMLKVFSRLDHDYHPALGTKDQDSPHSNARALAMSAFGMAAMERGWRHWQARMEDELGLPLYPAPGES